MSHPEFKLKILMSGERPSPQELKMIRQFDKGLVGVPASDIRNSFSDKGFHTIDGLIKPYIDNVARELDENGIEYSIV